VGGIAYVFSSKTRGDPTMVAASADLDVGTGAVRTTLPAPTAEERP
jgi:hypothetical protein